MRPSFFFFFFLEALAGLRWAFINMQIKYMICVSFQGYFINFIFSD